MCSILFTLALSARAALADPPLQKPKQAAALEHLERAGKLYNVRAFEKAVDEYKAGALIDPAPVFDYNLAQCYRQLHRYADAIWHYQRFIHESPETPEHVDAAQKFITEMQAELNEKAMTEPPTEPADTTSQPKTPRESKMSAAPPPAAIAMPTQAIEPWYDDAFGWGLAGSGLLAVGISGALFVDASGLDDDANHATTQSEANQLRDRANTRSLLGTAIGIGGAAIIVTGIVKLAIHPSAPASPTAWNVGASSNGIVVFGHF
jgi:tetratricopeptide (TPR) repeat protein